MSIEAKFKKKYNAYLANFKILSYDSTNQESLCQNTTHYYYNFDAIVKARNCKPTSASPDTLIFKGKKLYCVEFKNSLKKGVKAKIIKKKLEEGFKTLSEIFTELGLNIKDCQLIFCVVYKGTNKATKNKKRRWGKIHDNIRDKRSIQFDLEQYKNVYFDDIFTNNVEFFRDQFIEKIDRNLPC
jgi:hypothetical protein